VDAFDSLTAGDGLKPAPTQAQVNYAFGASGAAAGVAACGAAAGVAG